MSMQSIPLAVVQW